MYRCAFILVFYEKTDQEYYNFGKDAFQFKWGATFQQWIRLSRMYSNRYRNDVNATPTSGKSYKNAEQYKITPRPISPYPTPVIQHYKKLTSC